MRIDVSEVKCYRECKRKHEFSSRNRLHLRLIVSAPNLVFGTLYHECLHMMYLGASIDKVLAMAAKEVSDASELRMITQMITGYYTAVLPADLEQFQILDIEKSFKMDSGIITNEGELVEYCGCIDMVAIDRNTKQLVGFEHKTAKNFRQPIYNLVDEQPRLYSIALKQMLEDYHKKGLHLDIESTGPIYLNQIKKLMSKFEYKRDACVYSDKDLQNFYKAFKETAVQIVANGPESPEPGFMKCQMCDYQTLCLQYGYEDIDLPALLNEFGEEFIVRDVDHLDEKVERSEE